MVCVLFFVFVYMKISFLGLSVTVLDFPDCDSPPYLLQEVELIFYDIIIILLLVVVVCSVRTAVECGHVFFFAVSYNDMIMITVYLVTIFSVLQ